MSETLLKKKKKRNILIRVVMLEGIDLFVAFLKTSRGEGHFDKS